MDRFDCIIILLIIICQGILQRIFTNINVNFDCFIPYVYNLISGCTRFENELVG